MTEPISDESEETRILSDGSWTSVEASNPWRVWPMDDVVFVSALSPTITLEPSQARKMAKLLRKAAKKTRRKS